MRCYIIEYIGERGNYEISKLECKWNKSMLKKGIVEHLFIVKKNH